jgi:hypothetical protein
MYKVYARYIPFINVRWLRAGYLLLLSIYLEYTWYIPDVIQTYKCNVT